MFETSRYLNYYRNFGNLEKVLETKLNVLKVRKLRIMVGMLEIAGMSVIAIMGK